MTANDCCIFKTGSTKHTEGKVFGAVLKNKQTQNCRWGGYILSPVCQNLSASTVIVFGGFWEL